MARDPLRDALQQWPRQAAGGLSARRNARPRVARRAGNRRCRLLARTLLPVALMLHEAPAADPAAGMQGPVYEVRPIGWIRKAEGRTTIEIEPRYAPGLYRLDELDAIWVLYWFDRNDTPEQRSILQVHPRGNPANPLRGVFATRAPVRPNLIALSRCRVLAVQGTTIVIDGIDAFAGTPVLDIKP